MSCCLLRTGCSTRRPTLCPSCTWATSPCLAARPSGRVDSPGGRSPPRSPLFYTPPSLWKTAAASAKERRELYPPTSVSSWTVNHGTSVNGGDRNRPNSLYLCLSHIFSEGQTAGLIMCVSLVAAGLTRPYTCICGQKHLLKWMCISHQGRILTSSFFLSFFFFFPIWRRFVSSAQY